MRKEMITFRTPKSPVSEMFKTLRTNIQFMNTKGGLKSLLFTSTMPGEGKSWVSANLAVTFAQAGKKVILVDSDMRKGRQFAMFGVKPTPGLSNYLSGYGVNGEELSDDILQYIRQTEVENLYLIPSGSIPPNPSELLISERTVEMIEKLENMCDLVIFDGTPSLIVTDSVILSRLVDSTIIVSSHKETRMDNLETVKKNIENVGGKIGGVVLNKIPVSQKKYESEYYYYGNKNALVPVDTKSRKSKKVKVKQNQEVMNTLEMPKKTTERNMEKQSCRVEEKVENYKNNSTKEVEKEIELYENQSYNKVEQKTQYPINNQELNARYPYYNQENKVEPNIIQQNNNAENKIEPNVIMQNNNRENKVEPNVIMQNNNIENKIEPNAIQQNNNVERMQEEEKKKEQDETSKMIAQLNAYLEKEKAKLDRGEGKW